MMPVVSVPGVHFESFGEVSAVALQIEDIANTFDTRSSRRPQYFELLDRTVHLQLQPSSLLVNGPSLAYVRYSYRRREKPIGPFGVILH